MSRHADQSRRFLAVRSWVGSERVTKRQVNGVTVHDVGSAWAELETSRFAPRKWLDALVQGADLIMVISGSPAVCNAVRRAKAPIVLHVATLVKLERHMQNSRLKGVIGLYRRVTTAATSRLDDLGLRVPARVLVMNSLMLQESRSRGIARVEICPPGVDSERFAPGIQLAAQPYILMVARLSDPRKNLSGLICAYAMAREKHGITHHLVLAGLSGPTDSDLRLINELNIESSVHIHSPVSETELVRLYQEADLFASASFEEGYGLTFLEAMSCAVAVITTITAGSSFILGDSSAGALLPQGQDLTDRFAAELGRWCNDADLRRRGGEAARARVLSNFSDSVTARRIVEVIDEARRNP